MRAGPNVVLLVFDTARADVFEPYGAPPGSSPAAAQMAADGEVASRAYAPASWTVPSHAGMFTGLLPRSAGFDHRGGGHPASFRAAMQDQERRVLASVLRRAGWETAGVSANAWVHRHSGFDVGFDEFHAVGSERARSFAQPGRRAALRWYVDGLRAHLDDGAGRIEAMLAEWGRRHRKRPFFWFVNLVECHSPYLPPRPWNRAGPVGRLRAAHDARCHLTFESIWMSSVGGFRVPDGAMTRMRRQYTDSIRQLDAWLARFFEGLSDAGLLDDTLVVLTSDHGENLGEDRMLGHAFSLDDRLIRVPLLARGPVELGLGERPVSLTELPALLGDALDIHHPWEAHASDRIPVAQFDAPGRPDDPRVIHAVADWGLGEDAVRRLCTSFTCATDGRLKLLRRDGTDVLVDLVADPLEQSPAPTPPGDDAAVKALRSALDAAERAETPAPRADETTVDDPDGEADRIEEQLRLLGYL